MITSESDEERNQVTKQKKTKIMRARIIQPSDFEDSDTSASYGNCYVYNEEIILYPGNNCASCACNQ